MLNVSRACGATSTVKTERSDLTGIEHEGQKANYQNVSFQALVRGEMNKNINELFKVLDLD